MDLGEVFESVVHKRLVSVDLPNRGSNEHEINGVQALRSFFSTQRTQGSIRWKYFSDDSEPLTALSQFTFYDARAKSAARTGRTEWRLYYKGSFLNCAAPSDLLVLARTKDGEIYGFIFQAKSWSCRAAQDLFGLGEIRSKFEVVSTQTLAKQQIEFLRSEILGELGLLGKLPPRATDEEIVEAKFGDRFPPTREMAQFARSLSDGDWTDSDACLMRWLDREEELFRALEKLEIDKRLSGGFLNSDEAANYFLAVHQRRKSRMGHSFQHHLAELFKLHSLRFSAQACTEGKNKPDFLFPSQKEYHDLSFDSRLLVMLGVKSTSKERWRQVLVEADRIPDKHLCTLEAGISEAQTEEMRRKRLTLVLPVRFHTTYTDCQKRYLISLTEFIGLVRKKQADL